jgi:hypothetical protein
MYGLSISTNLEFMLNKELIQICIGLYQIILKFSGELTITAECKMKLVNGAVVATIDSKTLSNASHLIPLLGKTILDVNNLRDGSVRLKFTDSQSLTIFDSNDSYESYQIDAGGTEKIVV